MAGPTPRYPPEFKKEAVELYRSSERSIPKVAKELGIADECLRKWIHQHEIDAGEREGFPPRSVRNCGACAASWLRKD